MADQGGGALEGSELPSPLTNCYGWVSPYNTLKKKKVLKIHPSLQHASHFVLCRQPMGRLVLFAEASVTGTIYIYNIVGIFCGYVL